MLLFHFSLCCLSSSTDYCHQSQTCDQNKRHPGECNKQRPPHDSFWEKVLFLKLIEGQGDLSREVYICLLHLMRCRLELAGFFTSKKAYCVPCASFIYINISTED